VERSVLKTCALLPLSSVSDNSTNTAFPLSLLLLQHIFSALSAFFLILNLLQRIHLVLLQSQAGSYIPTFTPEFLINKNVRDACSKLRCSSSQRDLPLYQRTESGRNGRYCRSDRKLRGCDQQCWHRASKRDSRNFEHCR
jgi:hypothetical protein